MNQLIQKYHAYDLKIPNQKQRPCKSLLHTIIPNKRYNKINQQKIRFLTIQPLCIKTTIIRITGLPEIHPNLYIGNRFADCNTILTKYKIGLVINISGQVLRNIYSKVYYLPYKDSRRLNIRTFRQILSSVF